MPAIDKLLGFHKILKYNYFPGWHQPATMFELLVNKDVWEELDERLPELLQDRIRIYHDLGKDPAFDSRLIGWLAEFRGKPRRDFHAPEEIIEVGHLVHDMRLYKSRAEISAMRRAAKVAVAAHERAMRATRPGPRSAR